MRLIDALKRLFSGPATRRPQRRSFQPALEALEGRWCPANITWDPLLGSTDGGSAHNWSTGTVPSTGDTAIFDGLYSTYSNGNCTIANNVSMGAVEFENGYSGTLTLNGLCL